MNKLALVLVAGMGIAGFGSAALAQDSSAMAPASDAFAAADANHDGFVDYGEALAVAPELTQNQFDQIDTNNDDKLDANEFAQLPMSGQSTTNVQPSSSSSAAQ